MADSLAQLTQKMVVLDLPFLLLNILVGAVLASGLRLHYVRFGSALGNREAFSRNFVTVCLSIILIISIVRSSLALALGLVGALSIVRFRTPIKEPEELAYLFLAIALGIGLGANQLIATTAAFLVILALLALSKAKTQDIPPAAYIELTLPTDTDSADVVTWLSEHSDVPAAEWKVTRLEADEHGKTMSFSLRALDQKHLSTLVDRSLQEWPTARILVLDQDHVADT